MPFTAPIGTYKFCDTPLKRAPRRGGCRIWTLLPTPNEAASGTTIPASAIETWVGGVYPTSVCVGGKFYEVRLRPLVPGERP